MKTNLVKVGKAKAIVIPDMFQHLLQGVDDLDIEVVDDKLIIQIPSSKTMMRELMQDDCEEQLLTDMTNEF